MDVADEHEKRMLIIGEIFLTVNVCETGVLSQRGLSIAWKFRIKCQSGMSYAQLI